MLLNLAERRSTPLLTRQCERNCSFVSGHASTGFALMALGVYGKRRQRRRWLAIGWAAGLSLGLIRIAQGGHFLGDVLFAGLLMWGLCLAMRPILLGTFRFFSAERIVWRRV
jgi:lipid A 4'-phosphatase